MSRLRVSVRYAAVLLSLSLGFLAGYVVKDIGVSRNAKEDVRLDRIQYLADAILNSTASRKITVFCAGQNGQASEEFLSVRILPRPPENHARELFYTGFVREVKDTRDFIIFDEVRDGVKMKTSVQAEDVDWDNSSLTRAPRA